MAKDVSVCGMCGVCVCAAECICVDAGVVVVVGVRRDRRGSTVQSAAQGRGGLVVMQLGCLKLPPFASVAWGAVTNQQ